MKPPLHNYPTISDADWSRELRGARERGAADGNEMLRKIRAAVAANEGAPIKRKAVFVALHPHMFRPGVPADVLGVLMVCVNGEFRACYHLRYADGAEDHSLICQFGNYRLDPAP